MTTNASPECANCFRRFAGLDEAQRVHRDGCPSCGCQFVLWYDDDGNEVEPPMPTQWHPIRIPLRDRHDYWSGTEHVLCPCGGWIEWAEAGYTPGTRACRKCRMLYTIDGEGSCRRLTPVSVGGEPERVSEQYRFPNA